MRPVRDCKAGNAPGRTSPIPVVTLIIMKESEKTLFLFELSVRSARSAFHVVTLAPSANPKATLAEMRYRKFVVSAKTSSAAAPARFPRISNCFRP